MSDERFKLAYEKGIEAIFEDLAKYPYPRRMTNKEVERKLNEQQATIDEQKIIIEERDVANERLNRFLIEIGLEKEYRIKENPTTKKYLDKMISDGIDEDTALNIMILAWQNHKRWNDD